MTRTLDLPLPPSVNSIWRHGRRHGRPIVYLDAKYRAWKREAEGMYFAQKRAFGGPVLGRFTARIILDERRRGSSDADNRIKCALDALQRFGVIANDRLADKVSVEWGEADAGCKVIISEVAA